LIRKFDTHYFMISVDTLEQNKAFALKENADFPLLADPTKETAAKYGVLRGEGDAAVANRWTFYIGPDGKILAIDKMVVPAKAGEAVVAKLEELQVKRR
jgi:peroxiredoxin Q/BCP